MINTYISVQKEWNVGFGFNNSLTLTFRLNGIAFDISTYAFTLGVRRIGGGANVLSLTEVSGITNGGTTGILTIQITKVQTETIDADSYFYTLNYTKSGLLYSALHGTFNLLDDYNPNDINNSVTVPVNIGGINLDCEVTLAGSSQFLGYFISLAALQTAYPTAEEGNYAYVDEGVGENVITYIWDSTDNSWVEGGGGGGVQTVTGDGVDNTDPENPVLIFPTKSQIGLSDVDNTSDVNKPVSTAQAAADAAVLASANAHSDALVVGLWDDRGNFDASVNAYPSSGGSGSAGAILKGDIWTVSIAGTLPTGLVVGVGDTVRALIDTPGNTQANWAIAENNIGYVPENQANKENTTLDTSTTKYPTNRLVKEQLDLKAPLASPALTGNPTAPTQSASDNSTKLATTAYTDNQVDIYTNRVASAIVTTTLTLDWASKRGRFFDLTSTVSGNFTIAFSNDSNKTHGLLTMRATGTIAITMPSAVIMDEFEKINGRWNESTNVLTIVGTTATPFLIQFISDGTNVWAFCTSKGL